MGVMLGGNCHNCGFSIKVAVGGNRANHMNYAAWPILCYPCEGIRSTNTRATPCACETCGSTDIVLYGDPSLSEASELEIASWRRDGHTVDRLPGGMHLCPQCRKHTLAFKMSRMFD